jgi:hypothetical protein
MEKDTDTDEIVEIQTTTENVQMLLEIILARHRELRERKERLLGELVPMEAAIYELERILANMGETVEDADYIPTMVRNIPPVNMQVDMERTIDNADSTANAGLARQPVGAVARTPVEMRRTGPDGKPADVSIPGAGFVPSPKTGTPVPTNVEVLKQALLAKRL